MKDISSLEQYKLSEKYTVYRTKYSGPYTKQNFIQRVNQNKFLYFENALDNYDSLPTYLQCDEFSSLEAFAVDFLKTKLGLQFYRYIKSSWVYFQTPEYRTEWMHTHEWVESSNRIKVKTNWTFVYYIQIPTNLKGNQGDLIFKTEDKVTHSLTPKENEIIFFPGDLPHMPIPTIGADCNRIVYTTNINYDFNYVRETNKRVHFYNHVRNES